MKTVFCSRDKEDGIQMISLKKPTECYHQYFAPDTSIFWAERLEDRVMLDSLFPRGVRHGQCVECELPRLVAVKKEKK